MRSCLFFFAVDISKQFSDADEVQAELAKVKLSLPVAAQNKVSSYGIQLVREISLNLRNFMVRIYQKFLVMSVVSSVFFRPSKKF